MKPTASLTAIATCLFAGITAPGSHASVVIRTGFETAESPAYPAAVANLPGTNTLPVYDQNTTNGTKEIRNDSSPFNTGQYLAVGGASVRVRSNNITALSTITFDLYEPSGFSGSLLFGWGSSDLNGGGSYLSWGLNNGALSLNANTGRISGSFPTLVQDRHYVVRILTNRSGAPQSVDLPNGGGTVNLEDGEAALLIQDTVTDTLLDCGVFNHTLDPAITPSTFYFRTFSGTAQIAFIDNFIRYDTLEADDTFRVWDGEGSDGLWSTAANWLGDNAPVAGNDLIFSGAVNTSTVNDLVAGTVLQDVQFDASAGSFEISGNAIEITGSLVTKSSSNQTISTDLTLAAQRTLQVTGTGDIYLEGVLSGDGGLIKTGSGPAGISGTNTYTGGTTANAGSLLVSGDQSAATGGWSIGATPTAVTTVEFSAASSIATATGKTIQVGTSGASGTPAQSLNVAGTVSNSGELYVGRVGRLNLNDGSAWNQAGAMTIQGIGGYGSTVTINTGGAFTYSGTAAVVMKSGTNDAGRARLTIAGGSFETALGFDFQGGGSFAPIVKIDGGTLRLTDDIPVLSNGALVSLGGLAEIDTGGHAVSLAVPVSGPGSLVKSGVGTLTLEVAPTHTGNTSVDAGTLVLDAPGLDDGSTVEIAMDAVLRLDFTGDDTVALVRLNGVDYTAPGSYNDTTYPDFFDGAGSLVIPGTGFADWASNLGLSGDPNEDFDHDGLDDGVEYALAGLDPLTPDAAPGTFNGSELSFNKRAEAVANNDVTYTIETSTDLGASDSWDPLAPTVNDGSEITASLPAGPRNFARLKVVIATP